ncbi:MAG: hypothetical protein ABI443_01010 [Chthoniobacterales bacterium]
MRLELLIHDLSPGDLKSTGMELQGLTFHVIEGVDDPLFPRAYELLWEEFHRHDEMETQSVIEKRLRGNLQQNTPGLTLLYHMILVRKDEEFVAVRDHTAIVAEEKSEAIVHLSHALVSPEWRRKGIAGWLRAFPLQTAREALRIQGKDKNSMITLAGEMEHPNAADLTTTVRLKAYERAGYLKVDSKVVNYLQPDFRSPEIIDASGESKPLPMTLIIRRSERETERFISGKELRNIVDHLYRMYETGVRPQDMQPVIESLSAYPADDVQIMLVPPTA